MAGLREIFVNLTMEVDKTSQRKMGTALDNVTKKAGMAAKTTSGQLVPATDAASKSFLNFATVAKGLLAGAAVVGVARFTKSILAASSAAEETTNILDIAFGESAGEVEDFAVRSGNAMGRSRQQMRKMAASFGLLFQSAGKTGSELTGLSGTFTELAADLGSAFDVADEDVMVNLLAGLRGEAEPLRKFNVDVTEAALKAFLLSEGISKSTTEMSMQEKQMHRANLILSQTTRIQGDAVKTAGSFANQLKRFSGEWDNLKVVLGDFLVGPAASFLGWLSAGLKGLRTTAKFFGDLGSSISKFFDRFTDGLSTANKALSLWMKITIGLIAIYSLFQLTLVKFAAIAALSAAKTGVVWLAMGAKAALGWAIALAPMFLVIAAFAVIIAVIALVIEDLQAMGEGANSVSGTIVKGFQGLVQELGSIPAAIEEMLKTSLEFFLKFFGDTQDEAKMAAENILGFFKDVLDDFAKIGDFLGFDGSFGIDAPSPTGKAAAATVGASQNSSSMQNNLEVIVDASGTSDPRAVGEAVKNASTVALGSFERKFSSQVATFGPG